MRLSFHLTPAFVEPYKTSRPDWGYTDAAGNSMGEITFLRTYSRLKEDGTKERWWEVCERVINGMFSIQKDYAKANRLPWSDRKAQATAQDAYERLFTFRWTPPGRGLWMMGTALVNEHRNSAALQNCAFVSTGDMTKADPAGPFAFLMEASMLGIGVGFDTKGAAKGFRVYTPNTEHAFEYAIPDTREGWVNSTAGLINSYLMPGQWTLRFDYSKIRPAGDPIRTFGGTAAGPEPLQRLHDALREILDRRATCTYLCCEDDYAGHRLTEADIADIGNLIGVCVVSGNVRRSAELLMGSIGSEDFLRLKDYSWDAQGNVTGSAAYRAAWGWMSNNSVEVNVGDDLSRILPGIAANGEPGVIWMDLSRSHGRLADPPNHKDHRVQGYNPCAEQSLESQECCTLVETYIGRHEDLEDYKKTLKVAYLYAKTVTLLPTHWERTNAIMLRNRRIGTSIAGLANFSDRRGLPALREWMDEGYAEIQRLDRIYSEWLCIRESIKTTTIKPGGTTPLLAGESPGAHWAPGGEFFDRAIRFGKDDPMVTLFRQAGYRVEVALENPETTVVVYFPIHSGAKRSEADVSLYEKAELAATAQAWWSDNSVSVTLSFDPETEADDVAKVLHMYEGRLKTVSFLPMAAKGAYRQMPYTAITPEEHAQAAMSLFRVDLSPIYNGSGVDAVGEAFCTTDACEVKSITSA